MSAVRRWRVRLASRLNPQPPVEARTVTAVKVVNGVAKLTYSDGTDQCWCPFACRSYQEVCEHLPLPASPNT